MSTGNVQLKVSNTKKPETILDFFLSSVYQEESGWVFIAEEMESVESGKQFLAKNLNYVDEVVVDPSFLQWVLIIYTTARLKK